MAADTDNGDLDIWREHHQPPLSDKEIYNLRKLMDQESHATWLRKRIRVLTPWLIAVAGAIVAAVDWFSKNLKH